MKARKKPVVVDAWRVSDLTMAKHRDAVPADIQAAVDARRLGFSPYGLDVPTLEGMMHADIGDYLIRGVKGEFYPCKPDIFEMTYEPVED